MPCRQASTTSMHYVRRSGSKGSPREGRSASFERGTNNRVAMSFLIVGETFLYPTPSTFVQLLEHILQYAIISSPKGCKTLELQRDGTILFSATSFTTATTFRTLAPGLHITRLSPETQLGVEVQSNRCNYMMECILVFLKSGRRVGSIIVHESRVLNAVWNVTDLAPSPY